MDQKLWLLPQKAIYWPQKKSLLVADLHLGKVSHFRKHGISVPRQASQSNLDKLSHIIEQTKAERLIILGDLFHSSINDEWQSFVNWSKEHQALDISLVIGNHDILPKEKYLTAGLNLFTKLRMGPFIFVHDAQKHDDAKLERAYLLSGHVHPAIQLKHKGRQQLKLPCFHFGEWSGLLPAFGQFTGTHTIKPQKDDAVYLITENKILPAP